MKRNLIAFADPENNKLNPLSQTDFKRILRDFGQGTKLTITIEHYVRKRSLGQNNLFHLLCDFMAKELGETMLDMKMFLKSNYGVWEPRRDKYGSEMIDEDTGEILMKLKSTSDYSKEEKSNLINGCYDFSIKASIRLPDKEDITKNNINLL